MTSVEGQDPGSRGQEPRSAPGPGQEPRSAPGPGPTEEALRRLEQRLDQASQAAERLIAEAASEAAARAAGRQGPAEPRAEQQASGEPPSAVPGENREPSGDPLDPLDPPLADPEEPVKPPPAGWQTPETGAQRAGSAADVDVLVQLLRSLRDLIPLELQRRLAAALREVLLALRALIDWYLERLEQQREKPVQVEDIPIL